MEISEITKNIKKNYFYDSYSYFWRLLLVSIPIGLGIYSLIEDNFFDDFTISDYTFSEIIFTIFIISIFVLFFVAFAYGFVKNFYYYLHPNKNNIYNLYGNLDDVVNEISSSIEYDDKQIIISKNYIICKKDYRKLVHLNDILGVYIQVHKTNYVTDSYNIIVHNKYNDVYNFEYSNYEKDIANNVLAILTFKCKNAKFGYTNETLQYVHNNIVEKNNLPINKN